MPLPKRPTAPKAGKPKESSGDSRFSSFATDPRFRLPSKKQAKTKLDPRFAALKNDPDFYNKATVDKYGRKISKDAGKKDIERFFDLEDDDEDGEDLGADAKQRDKAVLKELARVEELGFDPIRDGGLESSSDESSEDEMEEAELVEDTELAGEDDDDVPTGEVTSRLAVVNLDWDNIRASDILAVANSFVPPTGKILNVIVYPSEFGMERMQREEIEGPPREIFASTAGKDKNNLTSLDDEPNWSDSEGEEDVNDDPAKENAGEGEEFDSKALRQYQLDRLRYYYAVITCSSPGVAKSIYDNLDGQEYLSSANFFDLRFVPDEVTFDEEPHDKCEKIPDGYKPNDFTTDALTHSKVKLTWDADDTTRREVQKRAFSQKEIDENELQAYLGSEQSSSEEEEEDDKAKKAASLRAALGLDPSGKSTKTKSKTKSAKRDRDFQKPDGELQITFTSGMTDEANKGSVFENDPEETTLEKYVRKQKERKQKRKERAKALQEGRDPDAEKSEDETGPALGADDEDPWNDPFFGSDSEDAKASKRESRKAERAKKREDRERKEKEEAAERANLELLMVDDEESNLKHFNMNEIEKAEKAKKKGKKRAKGKEAIPDDNFKINTNDPRFAQLYESHEYAIDPTNPRFKGTSGMKALLEEGRKKRKHGRDDDEDRGEKKAKTIQPAADTDDLKKLAARVKAKSKKA
ncbi:hypothetical protein BS50DRAFT_533364 [Corynespora cassiicola Philippines]|uniref:Uncharacterized protein n=1 Tax=Corynespora cassiicola Philippines TaxID=1448308 RepID=A0A2T2NBA1_CORCC|nr:hypothetical protein BS50DRAFT_533364 [Corynespora cassiicola Philippines]